MEQPTTLSGFKWMFRDTALWACSAHSPAGGIEAVRRVLTDLQVLDLPMGPGVRIRNPYDVQLLPDGTIVSQYDPTDVNRYEVYVKKGRSLRHVLGAYRDSNTPYLVHEMPGFDRPAWLDDEPVEDEATLLQEWKREAWNVGWKAKVRHNWCGDFERVMFGMDIRP